MKSYWALIRGEHGVLTAISSVASYLLAGGRSALYAGLIGGSAFLAEAALFAHNDLANQAEDRVNRPNAPLVTGEVSQRAAKVLVVSSAMAGLAMASALSAPALLIYIAALALGFFYNIKGKRVPLLGNLIVAFLTSMVYLYGMEAAYSQNIYLLLLFIASFLANIGREFVKSAIDYHGDRAVGIRTVAAILGPGRAASLGAYFTLASASVGLYLFYILVRAELLVLATGVAITTVLLLYYSIICLRGSWSKYRTGTLFAFGVTLVALLLQGILTVMIGSFTP